MPAMESPSDGSIAHRYTMLRTKTMPLADTQRLSPVLQPMKKVLSFPRTSSSSLPASDSEGGVLRGLIKKTSAITLRRHSSGSEYQPEPTEGPITKSFKDIVHSSPGSYGSTSFDEELTLDDLLLSPENVNADQSSNSATKLGATSNASAVGTGAASYNSNVGNVLTTSENNNIIVSNKEIISEQPVIPEVLLTGLPLLRITHKKKVQRVFRIDLEKALLVWNNKSSSRMSLDKIQQIKVADDAKNYREEYKISKEHADRWATIIYADLSSNKLKALHIIAPQQQDFDLFVSVLTRIVTRRRELMRLLSIPSEKFADIHWKNYVSKDTNNKELLSWDDVLKLTKGLHINCDQSYLYQIFVENDVEGKGSLNFVEFQKFVKSLKSRPELIMLFNRLTHNTGQLDYSGFRKFITITQRQNESDKAIGRLFDKFSCNKEYLVFDDFNNFLTSSYLAPTRQISEDLKRPLNEYYISSSHNTYLLGRQVGGSSSIEAYTKALQRGCRSIEVDLWDGDQGPVVCHGRAFTSSINSKDVFDTIRKYAFIVTPLPLILSLEVHCKSENQMTIVSQLKEILGEALVTKPVSPQSLSLPSPQELKHRILVKVKRSSITQPGAHSNGSFTSTSSTAYDETTSGDELHHFEEKKIKKQASRKNVKIIPQLSELGVYALGLKFTNFSLPESKTFNHIFSFSENNFNTMVKDPEKDYLIKKHNRKYLMRVYPSGFRYSSTNFNPIPFWNAGVQMVATNWQTFDQGQMINEAMFNVGSKSGYVLKPDNLRNLSSNSKFRDLHELETSGNWKKSIIKFSIDIISAQYLPRPKELKPDDSFDPYVIFEVIESKLVDGDLTITDLKTNSRYTSNSSFPTHAIKSNGFNPVWNTRFEGKIVDINGLNFFKLVLKTRDIPFAIYCFKLDHLNQGFRHVPLYDIQGEEYIFSTLFIRVTYDKVQ